MNVKRASESDDPLRRSYAALAEDRAKGALKPLSEYLGMFSDDLTVARAYVAVLRGEEQESIAGASFAGRYELERELGRGGQGTVFLATDLKLGRKVALKILSASFTSGDAAVERFRREAEIVSKLDHPGICPLFDVGVAGGSAYIAMQFIEGETWAKRIADRSCRGTDSSTFAQSMNDGTTTPVTAVEPEGPHSTTQGEAVVSPTPSGPAATREEVGKAVLVAERVLRALHFAHERGVVHRDMKPGNVVITPDESPVVLDFGLAQDDSSERPGPTRTGELLGTPAYLSPEQLSGGTKPIDRRADVYAVGVSLFEALAFRKPFEAPTRQALFRAILSERPPDLRRLNPNVGKDLAIVVGVAIEKDANRRYRTALDFAEDLRRVAAFEPILARPPGIATRVVAWARRNPVAAALLAAVVLALVGGLATALHLLGEKSAALVEKNRAVREFESLSDMKRCRDLVAEADALWPSFPSRIDAMKAWLERARRVAEEAPRHAEELRALESADVAPGSAGTATAWRREYLRELVQTLRDFTNPDPRAGPLADVEERLEFARSVRRRSIEEHADRWARAIESIADKERCPRYGGLRIEPQLGLIPLGRRPESGLWEFACLDTGTLPDGDGVEARFEIDETSAIVLILVPGGSFKMGTDKSDDELFAYEAAHRTTLKPYFLSKYEITQGQWLRATGENPGFFRPGSHDYVEVTLLNPVTNVAWPRCDDVARRLNLELPTEAQWEFACRAGTTSAWHWGDEPDCLEGHANVADLALVAEQGGRYGMAQIMDWDDRYGIHSPVTAFPANAFGFKGFHGNVSEWCRDLWNAKPPPDDDRPGDGLFPAGDSTDRSTRDGSWLLPAENARSARRTHVSPETATPTYGVRFSRPLYEADDAAGR